TLGWQRKVELRQRKVKLRRRRTLGRQRKVELRRRRTLGRQRKVKLRQRKVELRRRRTLGRQRKVELRQRKVKLRRRRSVCWKWKLSSGPSRYAVSSTALPYSATLLASTCGTECWYRHVTTFISFVYKSLLRMIPSPFAAFLHGESKGISSYPEGE
ncbi:hypothetical protein CPB85DRAFT_1354746, partial [Mucidula mucida]